jgi:hypothetical protein
MSAEKMKREAPLPTDPRKFVSQMSITYYDTDGNLTPSLVSSHFMQLGTTCLKGEVELNGCDMPYDHPAWKVPLDNHQNYVYLAITYQKR